MYAADVSRGKVCSINKGTTCILEEVRWQQQESRNASSPARRHVRGGDNAPTTSIKTTVDRYPELGNSRQIIHVPSTVSDCPSMTVAVQGWAKT